MNLLRLVSGQVHHDVLDLLHRYVDPLRVGEEVLYSEMAD